MNKQIKKKKTKRDSNTENKLVLAKGEVGEGIGEGNYEYTYHGEH